MPRTKTKTKTKTKVKTKTAKKEKKSSSRVLEDKSSSVRAVKDKIKKGKAKKEKKEVKKEKKVIVKPERYLQSEGKRKTSIARVRMWTKGEKEFLVNGKPLEKYFSILELQKTALASLEKMKCLTKFRVSVIVKGGGISSQAEAIRHGIAKILVIFNPDFRKRLKKAGFLRRDSRIRERKKFGLRRARRAKQWSKR